MATDNKKVLNALLDSQFEHEVKYTDNDGKKQVKKITMQDPGTEIALDLTDMLKTAGDRSLWSDIFAVLMDKVIIDPDLDYGTLNKGLPKELQTKEVEATNKSGEKVTLKMKFPNYRDAFDILLSNDRVTGASNRKETLANLNKLVFVDKKDNHIDFSYWDKGGDGYGLVTTAMKEANNYLAEILNRDGLMPMLMESFRKTESILRAD